MKNCLLTLCIALFPVLFFAQDLEIKGETLNPSESINDGTITVTASGGVSPYTYRWSNQSTPLSSNKAVGLTEGVPYTVVVSDAAGATKTAVFTVKTGAITEVFNGTMTPAVATLGAVLFWDPFAAIGVYDPVVYADVKQIGVPDWTNTVENKYVLKQWLKPEGAQVSKDVPIAIITDNTGKDITVNSLAQGKLKQLTAEGQTIYNSENKKHVIEQ